jgi:hypothetical protein
MKEEVRGKKEDTRRIFTRIPGLIIECPSDFEVGGKGKKEE